MHDILFRGRRKDNGEWVEGYFVCDIHNEIGAIVNHIVNGNNSNPRIDKIFSVEPYTVGEFTGLTDKNGKKIFEGDILQNDQLPYMVNGKSIYYHEVVWMNDVSAFGLYVHKNPKARANGLSHGEMQYIEDFDSSDWEVVGNIHDNSDMML